MNLFGGVQVFRVSCFTFEPEWKGNVKCLFFVVGAYQLNYDVRTVSMRYVMILSEGRLLNLDDASFFVATLALKFSTSREKGISTLDVVGTP